MGESMRFTRHSEMIERKPSTANQLGLFSLRRLNWMWDLTVIKYIKILLQAGKNNLFSTFTVDKPRKNGHKLRGEKKRLDIKKLSNWKDDEGLQ